MAAYALGDDGAVGFELRASFVRNEDAVPLKVGDQPAPLTGTAERPLALLLP